MTCERYSPLISKLIDGELEQGERSTVESHLGTCARCRHSLEVWRHQGATMRMFFGMHSLDEGFVRRVRALNGREMAAMNKPGERGWSQRDFFAWVQAAAAVLILVVLVAQVFRQSDGIAIGRVLNPGDRLEVRATAGSIWENTTIGEALRRGDWLRNTEAGQAQVLLGDDSRITLRSGALARLSNDSDASRPELILLQGAMDSDSVSGSARLRVKTPAGTVKGNHSRFELSMKQLLLVDYRVGDNSVGVVQGAVLPLGEVRVHEGKVDLYRGSERTEITGGSASQFTDSLGPAVLGRANPVQVSLREAAETETTKNRLVSSLEIGPQGLRVKIEIQDLPVARLIEWALGSTSQGGEDRRISGSLSYTPDAPKEAIADAICKALNLEMTIRDERIRTRIASFPALDVEAVGFDSPRRFKIRREPGGGISLDFQGVPAQEAFLSLRLQGIEVPHLMPADMWIPVRLKSPSLRPERITEWITQELGLKLKEGGSTVSLVEIRPATVSAGARVIPLTNTIGELQFSESSTRRLEKVAVAGTLSPPSDFPFQDAAARGAPSSQARMSGTVPQSQTLQSTVPADPVWSILRGGYRAGLSGNSSFRTVGSQSTAPVTTKIKIKLGDEHNGDSGLDWTYSEPALRLIWPVVTGESEGSASDTYHIANPSSQKVTVVWDGFDPEGFPVARRIIQLAEKSELSVVPARDFGVQLPGSGHWENFCAEPISGIMVSERSLAALNMAPVAGERISQNWEFAAASVSSAPLWIVNAGDQSVRVVTSLMAGTITLQSQEFILAPHAATTFLPEKLGLRDGTRWVIRCSGGRVAAGSAAGLEP